MTTIAIVYHSGFGHTAKQVDAVRAGVNGVIDVSCSVIAIDAER